MTPSKAKILITILTRATLNVEPGTQQDHDIAEMQHAGLVEKVDLTGVDSLLAELLEAARAVSVRVTEAGGKALACYIDQLEAQNLNLRIMPTHDADKPTACKYHEPVLPPNFVSPRTPITAEAAKWVEHALQQGRDNAYSTNLPADDGSVFMLLFKVGHAAKIAEGKVAMCNGLGVDANTPFDDPRCEWIHAAMRAGVARAQAGEPFGIVEGTIGAHIEFHAHRGQRFADKYLNMQSLVRRFATDAQNA